MKLTLTLILTPTLTLTPDFGFDLCSLVQIRDGSTSSGGSLLRSSPQARSTCLCPGEAADQAKCQVPYSLDVGGGRVSGWGVVM